MWKIDKLNYQNLTETILSNKSFWGQDLNNIPRLNVFVTVALELIEKEGVEKAYKNIILF